MTRSKSCQHLLLYHTPTCYWHNSRKRCDHNHIVAVDYTRSTFNVVTEVAPFQGGRTRVEVN